MAKYAFRRKGKETTCRVCNYSFVIEESCLYQPSHTIHVLCLKCNSYSYSGLAVFDLIKDKDKTGNDMLREVVNTFGFIPLYDKDGNALSFWSNDRNIYFHDLV